MAVLEIEDLSFTYKGADKAALKNINLKVKSGEFVLLCGESGCGKTTLFNLIKRQFRPNGVLTGEIKFKGKRIDLLDERSSVTEIGYVMQDPDSQTVTDKVWHELAFGLESLGEKSDSIRRKIAEICGFFGIGEWYHKNTSELSGGQKQLLALASIMVMNPSVLILDEPTAQLDPIAASEFLSSLRKINEELGVTILIAEHRLEEVFSMADKVVLMDKAEIFYIGTPHQIGEQATAFFEHKICKGFPSSLRIFQALGEKGECPLNVKEGKKFLSENYNDAIKRLETPCLDFENKNKAIEIKEGYFRYERETPDILSGLDLTVYENEFLCILGANGAGKTTLLKVLSGVKRLYKGKYRLWGKKLKEYTAVTLYRNNISCLPQDAKNIFVKESVYSDLTEVTKFLKYGREEGKNVIEELCRKLNIVDLYDKHPYDLSGGERQKAALAKILLMQPKILLLDEPTKGLDAYSKYEIAKILKALQNEGKTIIMVTHDIEFAAEYADRCAMFFDGKIVSLAIPADFFAENRFYTTSVSRMTRHMFENAVTVESAVSLCRVNGKRI